jgi:peroxiredoxin
VKRNLTVIIIVAAAIAVMLIVGKHLARRSAQGGGPGVPAGNAPKAGAMAPDFSLESLDGKIVRLADFRGKAVLLNFWATWCQPCKIEMPWFADLQKQYGPEGLQVIGVAMDDAPKQDIQKFAKEMGVNYLVLLGKESVGEAYGGVEFLPTTFYIDRNGKVIERIFGLRSRSEIEDYVKQSLSTHVAQAQTAK